jgi:hypothetical protein
VEKTLKWEKRIKQIEKTHIWEKGKIRNKYAE